MSTKDYYIRLKQMQKRLDRARQDIVGDVSPISRSNSPREQAKINFTADARISSELSTFEKVDRRKAANNTQPQSRGERVTKVIGAQPSKKSLQTSLKFK